MEDFKKFSGNYRGVVVDTRDPRDIGRIKILIHGVYPHDTPHEDLPWAIPALGMYQSGGQNMHSEYNYEKDAVAKGFNQTGTGGAFTVPFEGNHVWVFFDNGNHMYPVYFAMAPGEMDWITQKQYVKDKLDDKLEQIYTFRSIFQQEEGTKGFDGIDWADGAYINARQNISTGANEGPYASAVGKIQQGPNNFNTGTPEIKGGEYTPIKLNIDDNDENSINSLNMTTLAMRSWQNYIGLDIKPFFDKENTDKNLDRENFPHQYDDDWKYDTIDDDYERNINRYITSTTTANGVTEIYDNRRGQENYYFIHQNFIQNIDQYGSRKVFIGQNTTQKNMVKNDDMDRDPETGKGTGKGPDKEIRCNDELGVAGDKKTHIQGNRIDYVKGNHFTQVDKNTQIDVNDSYGIRVKKGDFDIVIEGDNNIGNDRNNDKDKREPSKTKQFGDLNIAVRNGNIEIYVKEHANVHIQGDVNLMVDGNMREYIKGDCHRHILGDYNEIVEGHKHVTVDKNCEFHYNNSGGTHVKYEINGEEFKDVHKSKHLIVGGARNTNISSMDSLTASHLAVGNTAHFTAKVTSAVNFQIPGVGLRGHQHTDTPGLGAGTVSPPYNDGGGGAGPSSPGSGANVGGGAVRETEESPLNNTKPTHNADRTQKAKRHHTGRTAKTKAQANGATINAPAGPSISTKRSKN